MSKIELSVVQTNFPADANVIVGQSHFMKTPQDLYEALVTSCPGIEFGVAFAEGSGDRKIRFEGNSQELIDCAVANIKEIGAGHAFIIVLKNAYPINVLDRVKNCQEVCRVYAATANPLQILVAETEQGRGIIGVVDGGVPAGVESEDDVQWRRNFLSNVLCYKR